MWPLPSAEQLCWVRPQHRAAERALLPVTVGGGLCCLFPPPVSLQDGVFQEAAIQAVLGDKVFYALDFRGSNCREGRIWRTREAPQGTSEALLKSASRQRSRLNSGSGKAGIVSLLSALLPSPPNYGIRSQIPGCFQHCTLTWRGRTSLGSWRGPKEPSDDTTFLWRSWCRNDCGRLSFRQQPWLWRLSRVRGKAGVGQALLGGAGAGAPRSIARWNYRRLGT